MQLMQLKKFLHNMVHCLKYIKTIIFVFVCFLNDVLSIALPHRAESQIKLQYTVNKRIPSTQH